MQINQRRMVSLCGKFFFCSSVSFYLVSLGIAEKEQVESAAPAPEVDDYEVDFLLDPELDALMQEL